MYSLSPVSARPFVRQFASPATFMTRVPGGTNQRCRTRKHNLRREDSMKRVVVLGALITIGALSVGLAAFQAPADQPKVVQVDKLKDNLYVLKGGGGNTTVFIG